MRRKHKVSEPLITYTEHEQKILDKLKTKIKIPSKYEERLLKRFSIKNMKRDSDEYCSIEVACPLCQDFADKLCVGCPLYEQIESKPEICLDVMDIVWKDNKVLGDKCINMSVRKLYWTKSSTEKVMNQLGMIKTFFNKFIEFKEI